MAMPDLEQVVGETAVRQQLVEAVYSEFLWRAQAAAKSEAEWRYLALGCATRFLEAIEMSSRAEMMSDALKKPSNALDKAPPS